MATTNGNIPVMCKKNVFYVFYSWYVFYVFERFFLFCQRFFKRSLKIPSEITFETTETNCVCMIVFLCAQVRISKSTYILTSTVTFLPYRLTSSDVTRRADKLQDTTNLESNLSWSGQPPPDDSDSDNDSW